MKSDVIRLRGGEHSQVIMKRITGKYAGILLVMTAASLLAGWTIDYTFYFLVPIIICLVYPFVLFRSYSIAALTVETAFSMRPHIFEVNDDKLIYHEIADDEGNEVKEDGGRKNLRTFEYNLDEIESITIQNGCYVIKLHGPAGKFLLIPDVAGNNAINSYLTEYYNNRQKSV